MRKKGRFFAPARDMRILVAMWVVVPFCVSSVFALRLSAEQRVDAGAGDAFLPELRDLLHHAAHFHELLVELVDVLDRGAGAGRDAALAAGVQELRIAALLLRHRPD